ncbi:helix-turn-helix domain-containing protein [Polaribacter glomeratus]|uniref:DNA-binding protein n=1 Tax=Polaribacter glomeratus TaxID=102 RepID=A0A2S7WYP1_9FLAO|nr:helix-turn-helix domain-containing protein [Polaribacter glomeratus]PQJ82700.1 DNA-binding protein [Polaribacter glomeratus]TXD63727.1 helix-turn-helix domain-containing protein [Polaribacter glomeratus]
MNAVILTVEQYKDLVSRLDTLNRKLDEKSKTPEETFLDNQDFITLMTISKRTAQTWRDEGLISFSQIGSKIYYRMGDVKKLLDKNYKAAFSSKKRNY